MCVALIFARHSAQYAASVFEASNEDFKKSLKHFIIEHFLTIGKDTKSNASFDEFASFYIRGARNEQFASIGSSIFPMLGILGTFISIAIAMPNFSSNNASGLESEISQLLSGVGTAFYISIYGIFLALWWMFFEKYGLSKFTRLISRQKLATASFFWTKEEIDRRYLQESLKHFDKISNIFEHVGNEEFFTKLNHTIDRKFEIFEQLLSTEERAVKISSEHIKLTMGELTKAQREHKDLAKMHSEMVNAVSSLTKSVKTINLRMSEQYNRLLDISSNKNLQLAKNISTLDLSINTFSLGLREFEALILRNQKELLSGFKSAVFEGVNTFKEVYDDEKDLDEKMREIEDFKAQSTLLGKETVEFLRHLEDERQSEQEGAKKRIDKAKSSKDAAKSNKKEQAGDEKAGILQASTSDEKLAKNTDSILPTRDMAGKKIADGVIQAEVCKADDESKVAIGGENEASPSKNMDKNASQNLNENTSKDTAQNTQKIEVVKPQIISNTGDTPSHKKESILDGVSLETDISKQASVSNITPKNASIIMDTKTSNSDFNPFLGKNSSDFQGDENFSKTYNSQAKKQKVHDFAKKPLDLQNTDKTAKNATNSQIFTNNKEKAKVPKNEAKSSESAQNNDIFNKFEEITQSLNYSVNFPKYFAKSKDISQNTQDLSKSKDFIQNEQKNEISSDFDKNKENEDFLAKAGENAKSEEILPNTAQILQKFAQKMNLEFEAKKEKNKNLNNFNNLANYSSFAENASSFSFKEISTQDLDGEAAKEADQTNKVLSPFLSQEENKQDLPAKAEGMIQEGFAKQENPSDETSTPDKTNVQNPSDESVLPDEAKKQVPSYDSATNLDEQSSQDLPQDFIASSSKNKNEQASPDEIKEQKSSNLQEDTKEQASKENPNPPSPLDELTLPKQENASSKDDKKSKDEQSVASFIKELFSRD